MGKESSSDHLYSKKKCSVCDCKIEKSIASRDKFESVYFTSTSAVRCITCQKAYRLGYRAGFQKSVDKKRRAK